MELLGAVEGGGTKFICGLGTREGEIVERIAFPTTTPEDTLGNVVNFFKDKNIRALGMGTFGPIDVDRQSQSFGTVTQTPKPFWSGFNVAEYIQHRLNVPLELDTDVNAAALGEVTWGAAQGSVNCLYMTVGTGIGAGAVIAGKPVHGLTHPEMGHILIRRHRNDPFEGNCPFHQDCLEGLAAGPAIEKRWQKKASELGSDHFAWELEAYYLAQALMNYILILSPQKIILGGGVMKQSQLFPLVRRQLQSLLNGYVQHPHVSEINDSYIVPPLLGDNAGLSGALALAGNASEK